MTDEEFARWLTELAEDRRRGASELARRCLEVAAESALHAPAGEAAALRALLAERAGAMAATRPTMAPIDNLLAQWRREAVAGPGTADLDRLREGAAAAARALVEESRDAVRRAAARAARRIGRGRTVMTHSLSSTVVELFGQLRDRDVRAIVTESRPLCEGYELAARLSAWAIPTTLITDAQIGLFVERADAVVVGADAVLAGGGVVNKAGTYPLALLAREWGVPFYVCCEGFKRRRADAGVAAPEPEEMAAAELGAPELPHVTVRNVYFDLTPARLVTALITERDAEGSAI